jgi:hypothetical protein
MKQLPLIPEATQPPVVNPEQKNLSPKESRLHRIVSEFLDAQIGPRERDKKTGKEKSRAITPKDIFSIYNALLQEEIRLKNDKKLSQEALDELHVTDKMIRSHFRQLGISVPYTDKELIEQRVLPKASAPSKPRRSTLRPNSESKPKRENPSASTGDLF